MTSDHSRTADLITEAPGARTWDAKRDHPQRIAVLVPCLNEEAAITRVVPTPGTLFHHLTSEDDPNSEPPSVMAEAALRLCSAEPKALTGRIARSQELLAELTPQ